MWPFSAIFLVVYLEIQHTFASFSHLFSMFAFSSSSSLPTFDAKYTIRKYRTFPTICTQTMIKPQQQQQELPHICVYTQYIVYVLSTF